MIDRGVGHGRGDACRGQVDGITVVVLVVIVRAVGAHSGEPAVRPRSCGGAAVVRVTDEEPAIDMNVGDAGRVAHVKAVDGMGYKVMEPLRKGLHQEQEENYQ